jgi:pyruvate/2-oxoglutarate dehydrogenase complex dihydrolipoamide acyltransferase (E2) component
MTTEVLLPRLGFAVDDATVTEWLAADGAQVAAGQPLYCLEADKSVNEIESPASGQLRIIAKTGEALPVGTLLAVIE